MKVLDRASLVGCWMLGQLFVWGALCGLTDQILGSDPRGASAFAQLMALAVLCAFVIRSYSGRKERTLR